SRGLPDSEGKRMSKVYLQVFPASSQSCRLWQRAPPAATMQPKNQLPSRGVSRPVTSTSAPSSTIYYGGEIWNPMTVWCDLPEALSGVTVTSALSSIVSTSSTGYFARSSKKALTGGRKPSTSWTPSYRKNI